MEEYLISVLRYLETPECRQKLAEEERQKRRKEITQAFRECLQGKEKRLKRKRVDEYCIIDPLYD